MQKSDHEKQDQKRNSGMEDSTAMTIEFLRARLLSERSVSRSARQRADELAKRVVDLEEQLKIVSLQRRKAEKATADVLAILEGNGMTDLSEAFDSSSDQETPCESKVGYNSAKDEENSADSKMRKNESEELSGSDLDSSPVPGRSLSWKGRKNTLQSLEKCKNSSLSRRSFASVGSSSPKRHPGKSCRQIKRRETRSIIEDFRADNVEDNLDQKVVASSANGFSSCLNGRPEILREGSEIQNAKVSQGSSLPHDLENGKNVTSCDLHSNEYGRDRDMEKALEHQAQLINRYEAMEKAQREWEEKFRENNSSTPDSNDPGNFSDVTDERDEFKTQDQDPQETVTSLAQESKLNVPDVQVSKKSLVTEKNNFLQPPLTDIQHPQGQNSQGPLASKSLTSERAFPATKEKQTMAETTVNTHLSIINNRPPSQNPQNSSSLGAPRNQTIHVFSSNGCSSSGKEEASVSQSEEHARVPHGTVTGLSSVLESLKQAKLSLQEKMTTLPSSEGGPIRKLIGPSVRDMKSENRVEIPVGCAGLFRTPTDNSIEGSTKSKFLSSGSRLSLGNYGPNLGVITTAGDRYLSGRYMDTRLSLSTDTRFLKGQSGETGPRISSKMTSSDPYLNTGLPSSSKYTFPVYPLFPDMMTRMRIDERNPRTVPPRTVGVRPTENLLYRDDGVRSSMYTQTDDFSFHNISIRENMYRP